jgi:hypothetical protein
MRCDARVVMGIIGLIMVIVVIAIVSSGNSSGQNNSGMIRSNNFNNDKR